MNTKGVHAFIMALETLKMMNKIMLGQGRNVDCPTGTFSDMWEGILADEQPDDAVTEMAIEDDLRKLKLPKDKDPKELQEHMAAIEVQYSTPMTDERKLAVALRADAKDYAVIMAMTSTMIISAKQRKPTAAEYIRRCISSSELDKSRAAVPSSWHVQFPTEPLGTFSLKYEYIHSFLSLSIGPSRGLLQGQRHAQKLEACSRAWSSNEKNLPFERTFGSSSHHSQQGPLLLAQLNSLVDTEQHHT